MLALKMVPHGEGSTSQITGYVSAQPVHSQSRQDSAQSQPVKSLVTLPSSPKRCLSSSHSGVKWGCSTDFTPKERKL